MRVLVCFGNFAYVPERGILEEEMDRMLARLFDIPLETILGWTRPGRFLSGTEVAQAGLAQIIDVFARAEEITAYRR